MPLFRTQSAAEGTSLAPHDSKAQLQAVTTRRRFMAKPCTPHPHCAARAVIRATNCQCRGTRGVSPRPFSWGCKGDILFPRKRISPFPASPARCGEPTRFFSAGKIKGNPLRGIKKGASLRDTPFYHPNRVWSKGFLLPFRTLRAL